MMRFQNALLALKGAAVGYIVQNVAVQINDRGYAHNLVCSNLNFS
jgi:hypothetical protein